LIGRSSCGRQQSEMLAFHLFSQLPTELRLQIWDATIEPRTVHVHCPYPDHRGLSNVQDSGRHLRIARFTSSTPVPAPLHACFEARNQLKSLYQKIHNSSDSTTSRASPLFDENTAQSYIWLIPEIDIVDIGTGDPQRLRPIAHLVERLQLECDPDPMYWRQLEGRVWRMNHFSNVKQVLIVNMGDMEDWRYHTKHRWPCGNEHVLIIDKGDSGDDGERVRLADIIARGH
jgi:hypothetical protein